MTLIPQEEEIDGGKRQEHIMFPRKAIREMLGNMIIHQDLTVHGSGFDRMEESMRDLTIPAPKVETGDDFTRTKPLYQE